MDVEGLEGFEHLQGLAEDNDFDPNKSNTPNVVDMAGVLNGSERIELSHAGGELGSLEEDLEDETDDESAGAKARKAEDWRTRRDRTERRNRAFQSQMPDMVASYIRYCAEQAVAGGPLCGGYVPKQSTVDVKLKPMENGIAPALVREGLLPCAPWKPSVAITLAIQSFVKSLCDMHGTVYRPYLCQQFSIAYNLYLDIRRQGEDKLIFDMLTTMDGNDSLKRVLRRKKTSMADDEEGEPVLGKSSERVDNRDAGDGYMYPWEKVERWAKMRLAEVLPMQSGNSAADNPCADRWKNMIDDVTSKMWGIFDETGAANCEFSCSRQQEITTYAKHFDSFETYANLTQTTARPLPSSRQEPALQKWMGQEGVDSYTRFHEWLQEEKDYLLSLKDALKTNMETLEMEYSPEVGQSTLFCSQRQDTQGANDAAYAPGVSKAELARRHGKEKVGEGLGERAGAGAAARYCRPLDTSLTEVGVYYVAIKRRKYRLALDALELLIFERIFELTKINRSQTGYKMRKHIAKALQARSKAPSSLLNPPMAHLTWEQVVEYAFLADFDILRDTRCRRSVTAMDPALPIDWQWIDSTRCNLDPAMKTGSCCRKRPELNSTEGKTLEDTETDREWQCRCGLYHERRGRFDDYSHAEVVDEEVVIDLGVRDEGEDDGWVEDDEGDDAMEEAVSDLLYTISMVAVDDKGPEVQES
ncbi:hypothetical protein B0H14DRAFT_3467664 [Mycena olivaceomarginata]|nr:hypothetical protein B0H14DRAFT_3467664 [Mycena olivaceomarginata]